MARAKTKNASPASEEKATISKNIRRTEPEVKEYSMSETFNKGEKVYHKIWDDTGDVLETGTTEDGINKMKVAFEKVGIKILRMA